MGNRDFPNGKYMTMVKVGAKGQVVIPAEAREMFGIAAGDSLLLLADVEQGIAIVAPDKAQAILQSITAAMGGMRDENH